MYKAVNALFVQDNISETTAVVSVEGILLDVSRLGGCLAFFSNPYRLHMNFVFAQQNRIFFICLNGCNWLQIIFLL